MTSIRGNPNRGDQEARDAFVGQTVADDSARLNCYIPSSLHYKVKRLALEEKTSIRALVVEALEGLLDRRDR